MWWLAYCFLSLSDIDDDDIQSDNSSIDDELQLFLKRKQTTPASSTASSRKKPRCVDETRKFEIPLWSYNDVVYCQDVTMSNWDAL